jgi:peptide/nickel transport system permease protein
MKALIKHKFAFAGLILLMLMLLIAFIGPFFIAANPYSIDLPSALQEPSATHPLGCDQLGRDIMARTIEGTRISLSISLVVTLVSLLAGTLLGVVAGYFGGWLDLMFVWIFDTMMAIPGLLLSIAVIAILGPSTTNLIIALCIMGWVGYARLARALTLRAKEEDYTAAARVAGASHWRVMSAYLLPNIAGPLVVQGALGMAGVIIIESTLSFLGLGAEIDSPSWGAMLNDGMGYLLTAPHLTIFPGIAIALTVLALNFIGDGLRDLLDVKSQ